MKIRKLRLIAVIGTTASGKSDLAVRLALKFGGEIISADSRQVYRGLDLGTGKITKKEMCGVPHHLLDVSNPKHIFTAAEFVGKGRAALAKILGRGNVPIIAGGTGFYISALLGECALPDVPPNNKLRSTLEKLDTGKLFAWLEKLDPDRAEEIDSKNRPRVIRAIEIAEALGSVPKPSHASLPYHTFFIGLDFPDKELRARIHSRLVSRLKAGMLAEAKWLHAQGLSWKRMEELGLEYRFMARHLQGKISKEEMVVQLEAKIWQYAKRQRAWFRRNKKIRWFSPKDWRRIEKTTALFLDNN